LSNEVAAPPSDPPKPKVGRPPKYGVAMSATERKRHQRERELRELEGPEREELIKKIKKRIKTSEHATFQAMRKALRQFHDVLDQMSIDDLREITKTYRIHDMTGRPSTEAHTGGVETEKIAAAVYRDTKYGGRKPKMGSSPNVDRETSTTPPRKLPSFWSIIPIEKPKSIRWNDETLTVWDCLPEITESMFEGDEKDFDAEYDPDEVPELTLRCRATDAHASAPEGASAPPPKTLCTFRAASWFDARKHVEEMIKKGEASVKFIADLQEIVDGGTAGYDVALADARRLYFNTYYPHHFWAVSVFRDIRAEDEKRSKSLKPQ